MDTFASGPVGNRNKKRDHISDTMPSFKHDTEADIGELFFSRETLKLSYKKSVNSFSRFSEDAEINILPYKVFTASLKMGSENIPVATILENTLGVDVFFERGDEGDYYAMFSETLFESQNAYVTLSQSTIAVGSTLITTKAVPVFFNVVNIKTEFDLVASDEVLGQNTATILEIRIYNDTII